MNTRTPACRVPLALGERADAAGPSRGSVRRFALARGFSLIEVLFAVLILGVALLGLGAMFPSVIRQQRMAADQTFGVVCAGLAHSYLDGHARLDSNYFSDWVSRGQSTASTADDSAIPADGSWYPIPVNKLTGAAELGKTLASGGGLPDEWVVVPLADRLYPNDASMAKAPGFVWDLAVRRLAALPGNVNDPVPPLANKVQIAVFVRRLDPRLQPPRNRTVYQSLLDTTLSDSDRRLPVAESETTGAALLDGTYDNARYSVPIVVNVQFNPQGQIRDVLHVVGGVNATPDQDKIVSQMIEPGQIIVDNFGNVYTVRGRDDRAGASQHDVRITPPVPSGLGAGSVRQVIMTSQAPAAVKVYTVNP